jgi:hypothetical protein
VQRLCDDLRAGESDAVIAADAEAVNNDPNTGTGNVALESLAYIASYGGYGVKSVEWERAKLLKFCNV